MAPKRPILLFAFANDEAYRLRLEAEERSLREALAETDRRKEIEYKPIGQASLDDIYNTFNNLNDQIYIFHYGGHSDSEFLRLSGGHARSESLATLIGQQKYLKLAFLNGCSNQAQVEGLLAEGVPAVIATNSPVGDDDACKLAEQFYKAMAGGKTIRKAFEAAASYIQNKKPELDISYRGFEFGEVGEENFPWGLYAQDDSTLDWHFGLVEQESNLETLAHLRDASRKRYQAFTGAAGRYQYLCIDEALLAGIENTRKGEAHKLIEARIGENKTPLENSLEAIWHSECPHALLVGAGGMGKTVSLVQLWEHFLDRERPGWPVPVFIPLNEFNNRPEKGFIRHYIKEHYGGEDISRILKEPMQVGEAHYPHLILLLDGFNEVTATSNELILEINELRAQDKYLGVQLVLSSRVDMRQAYQWQRFQLLELQPLSDDQIEAFLKQPLPTDTRLLELLRNPMMLSIYAAQTELPQRYQEKGLLKEVVTSTGEMLFNVEMLQRIKIEELHAANLAEQAFRRFILKHLLPAIGWQMQQSGLFFLDKRSNREGYLDMEKALQQAVEECLNDDFFDVFPFFCEYLEEAWFEVKPRKLFNWVINQVCCRELTLLVVEDGNYRFLHQNFRDYFAAVHVQRSMELAVTRNQGLPPEKRIFPNTLRRAPLDFYVRQLLGEIEEEHTNKIEWSEGDSRWQWSRGQFFLDNTLSRMLEQCRSVFDENQLGYTVWNLLIIWKEQRGELSGADLRLLNFRKFPFNGVRISRPGLPVCLYQGDLRKKSLFSQGHLAGVNSVAYSPDGRRILTGSEDNTAKVWDVETGQCLLTLESHSSSVTSVTYSPDGRHILTGSEDNTAKVWDVETGKYLLTLRGHYDRVFSATYSPDGQCILTGAGGVLGAGDNTAKVWDAINGECLLTLDGHSNVVTSVTYSPDGRHILTGSEDNTAKIWDVGTGQCLLTLEGYSKGIVCSVAYSPDGRHILTGSRGFQGLGDNTVKVWDAINGECLLVLKQHGGSGITSVAYSLDGRCILTGSNDGKTKVWDAETGQCLLTLKTHFKGIVSSVYSPDGQHILTGANDNTAKVWDAQNGQCLLILEGHSNNINSAIYSPDGQHILTGANDNTAKVWDAQNGQCLLILEGHSSNINSAIYSPDGQHILTGANDNTAKVWDAQNGQCLFTLEGHSMGVWSAAYSPNGRRILTGSNDNMNKVWDAQTGQCLLTFPGHSNNFNSLSYSPDGQRILTGSGSYLGNGENVVKVWDAQSGQCLLTLKDHPKGFWSATYSPDGQHILTGSGRFLDLNDKTATAKIWDAETGQCLLTLEYRFYGVWSATYSPDGGYILTGSDDRTAKVWDAQSGQCLLTLEGHSDIVRSVAYSPNGQRILTGSNQMVKIWNAETGQCLLTLPNLAGLYIQGCDFRNLHLDSELSEKEVALLRQYGGIFDEEDARRWNELMEKHFGIKKE